MENPENLSPEELAQRKEEMLTFYTESMPYLEAQLNYETKLSEIDEARLKRTQIQMAYAQIMTPPEEEETSMDETNDESKTKKRTLKKQEA